MWREEEKKIPLIHLKLVEFICTVKKKERKNPVVIKHDDKLREENYKFVLERYENNIPSRTQMKANKLQNSDDKRRPH